MMPRRINILLQRFSGGVARTWSLFVQHWPCRPGLYEIHGVDVIVSPTWSEIPQIAVELVLVRCGSWQSHLRHSLLDDGLRVVFEPTYDPIVLVRWAYQVRVHAGHVFARRARKQHPETGIVSFFEPIQLSLDVTFSEPTKMLVMRCYLRHQSAVH